MNLDATIANLQSASRSAVVDAAITRSARITPEPATFSSTLAQARAQGTDRRQAAANIAESKVGTALATSSTGGGCQCSKLVQQSYETRAAPQLPDQPAALLITGIAVPTSAADLRRGDVVITRDPGKPDLLHAGVALSNSTYATVNAGGMVVASPIPWDLIRAVRRP